MCEERAAERVLSDMRDVRYIVVHCTAGSQLQTVEGLQRYFREVRGWKMPGYHFVVAPEGRTVQLLDLSLVSNGVKGYNSKAVNVAWMGGIDAEGRATDNRTERQKMALRGLVKWLKHTYPEAEIVGHRDLSPDVNKNGKVDKWERLKECPCFDVKEEYKELV